MNTSDDGHMTLGCATCPEWQDSRDGLGGTCSLPKSAAITECPYFRDVILKRIRKG